MKWLNLSSIDWFLVIPVIILVLFSLVTLFSVDSNIFRSQMVFSVIGFVAFLAISQFNSSVLRYYTVPIYLVSLVLLTAVLFLGEEARGSVRWFTIFGVGIQFSELLKPFLGLAFASFLVNIKSYSFKNFLISLGFLSPITFLIFLQPDLGNALIYAFVVLGTLLVFGFPFKYFIGWFLLWLTTIPFFWLILHDYQKNRVLTFIDPSRDPLGTSYNAIQAVIAVGSGMILGRGLGQGTQAGLRFLPERHTDFIFATISEELGFIGASIIIICFCVIFYRLFLIIKNGEDKLLRGFALVTFMAIFFHFAVNVGMNLGLVPIVGVTLPFVSYGGSSLLTNFIFLGLLFALNKKKRREVLEIG